MHRLTAALDTRDVLLCVGLNGYAGACKWLTGLELTTFAAADAYWVQRGWAPQAPAKTASRIDRPEPLSRLRPGPAPIAGVARAQGRGIAARTARPAGIPSP